LLTLDVSRTEVNEKEPLSIADNGSQQSGRLAISASEHPLAKHGLALAAGLLLRFYCRNAGQSAYQAGYL